MALIIPPGFAHIALEFRHDSDPEPWYVTYGIDASNVAGDTVACGEYQVTAWHSYWASLTSTGVQMSGCQVTLGQDGGEPIIVFVATPGFAGTSTGDKLPQNCALLLRKNTALGGRRSKGRMFVPGVLDEGQVSPTGVIAAFSIGVTQTAISGFLDGLATAGSGGGEPAPMVLLHSTGNTAVPEPTPVVSMTVDNVISTQRRRLR